MSANIVSFCDTLERPSSFSLSRANRASHFVKSGLVTDKSCFFAFHTFIINFCWARLRFRFMAAADYLNFLFGYVRISSNSDGLIELRLDTNILSAEPGM